MKFVAYFRSLGAKFFHLSVVAEEMDEELRSHIEHRADDLERAGMSRAESERQARIEFGARERYREESYQALGGSLLDIFFKDVLYALRVLRNARGFAFAAVLTLAMAIGANAVVFSVVNGMFLKPLSLPEPQSLYALERASDKETNQSYPNYLDLRARNHSFADLAVFTIPQVGLDTGNGPAATWGVEASGNYFDALGIHPFIGRFFHDADERGPNSAPYIVLSYNYWRTQFHQDPGVVGRVVQVNKHPFTIIGVAPRDFHGTMVFYSPNFFVPLVNQAQVEGASALNDRANRDLIDVVGHLRPGVTPAQAVADLNAVGAYLEQTYPREDGNMTFALARTSLLGDQMLGPVRAFLAGLMLLAGLILLAACANLGSLFAARAADRSKELALRLALGSSRGRVLRSLFTEALLVALAGGALGIAASVLILRWVSTWQPFGNFTVYSPVTPDGIVYAMALVLTLASGFLFGAVPVRQVLRTSAYEVVKAGSTVQKGKRITARDLLLVVQIALCAVLVTSSLVAVRGMLRSLHENFGFDPQNSMLVDVDLRMAGYSGERLAAMQRRMLDAVSAIPGVESAGISDPLLLNDTYNSNVFRDDAASLKASNAAASVYQFNVSPQYLQAEGTMLLAGRSFTWNDDKDSPRVAVVNREFARRMFGTDRGAVGKHFRMPDGTRVELVGITETGKYNTPMEEPQPAMFLPLAQWPSGTQWIVVRSNRNLAELAPAIRQTLRALDPGLLIDTEKRFDEMTTVVFGPKMAAIVLGIMGVMGALLSITGIFGLAAYTVSKRLRELGIRIALGAKRTELLKAALGRALKLLAFGSAAGLALGLLATRVLALVVYQATPRDPMVLAGVVLAMAVLGLVATWIPAQRALGVDPLVLLREE